MSNEKSNEKATGRVVGEVRPGYHLEPGFEEPATAVDPGRFGVAGVLVAGVEYIQAEAQRVGEEFVESLPERVAGAKVVRVTATVVFEAYALTEGFYAGKSLEAVVAGEIADAIAYRAVHGTDTEEGDALIAMTSYPEFAVDVRDVEVSVLDRPVQPGHVIEQAEGTTGEW